MKITSFELNDNQVTAISGETRIDLTWEFIEQYKPQIGDSIIVADGVVYPFVEPVEPFEEFLGEVPPVI